ncbi:hypothetical protein AB0M95_27645 [Sphaerisporangium sp. NPDC051017]|uniref:hypothetical protein n=1 Tax=Sphaerisporangium sp. NPDC051017 TaxID=3154636 RepID=UPI0034424298
MGQSKAERDAAIKKIKNKICAEFGVTSDEVILKDNHDIVIDRRATMPWAKPMVVGKWS